MSESVKSLGLLADLMKLTADGSDDKILAGCAAVLKLYPVSRAVDAGAPTHRAVFVLLRSATADLDSEDKEHVKYAKAGAAIAGIYPRNTGQGVRFDAGWQARLKAAGNILGCTGRTAENKVDRYCQAYEHAIYDYVYKLSREPTLLIEFLVACGINGDDAARLTGVPASTDQPPRPDHQSLVDDGSLHARLARQIALSGLVRRALDGSRTSCEARDRAFYTSDLLLALLDMPRSRTADCFEETRVGLVRDMRKWLSEMNPAQVHPFQPFEWIERPDVQAAQDLAILDASPVVTEIYLLLGVLGSESGTRGRLEKFLGSEDYNRLYAVTNARRRRPPDVLRTPGPG
jgi:hypothetical protein